ncbi:hypothetical protein [Deinococcus altitudinis]|uniref:hypothetical protein n=1 Tax=Deinococcus altitudinis TaxID=468914 RepID=UPI0038927EA6
MDLQHALTAFQLAYQTADQGDRQGLSVRPEVTGQTFQVQVRHQDQDVLRGFDVVAEPLESEGRSAAEIGQGVAEVVQRELAYGQLSAADEDGHFKRVVV